MSPLQDAPKDAPLFRAPPGNTGKLAATAIHVNDICRMMKRRLPLETAEARGGAWNRDSVILFAPASSGPLYRISASGGAAIPVTKLDPTLGEGSHRWPSFLPDGRHFIFAARAGVTGDQVTIRAGSLDSPESKVILNADSNAIYAAGHLLFLRENTLAQPFDAGRLATTGDAMPVAEQIQRLWGFSRAMFSASESGLLLYRAGAGSGGFRLTWFDRNGKRIGEIGDRAAFGRMHLSPDRQRAAVVVGEDSNSDVWLYDLAAGSRSRFTFDQNRETEAIWSPDGRTIVFNSNRKGHFDLYRKTADPGGADELLYADSANKQPTSWSNDGRFLLYNTLGDLETGQDLWILPLTPERPGAPLKAIPMARTPAGELNGQFSPDGRWIAYQSTESQRTEIYVASFQVQGAALGGKRQVSTAGGTLARWRKDGTEIFYVAPDARLMVAKVTARGNGLDIGVPQPLFGPLITGRGYLYDVSADGQRILAIVAPEQNATEPLTLVQNWTARLKR